MIYVKTIEKRSEEKIRSLRDRAIERARDVAELLKTRYGVKRVILFGSIPRSHYLHERTDIDLLVEGLSSEDFLRAGAEAWTVSGSFDVDIIPMERAEKAIVKAALRDGIEL
jgi:predicted nucleotidyltransferase